MSETENTKVRAGRGVKIALALSLALNLAVVGLVGGAVLGGRGGPGSDGGPPALRTLGLGPFATALTRDERADLRGRLEGGSDALHEERRAIGRALRAVQEALQAEPFDRAAAEAAFETSRDIVMSLQATGHTALLAYFEEMTAEERADLADRLNRAMRRGGGRR